jgi:cbb3-type cytochrome oxidase subunit 3
MESFYLLRLLLILTVIIYFVFDHFDQRRVKDEREEMIRLKTFELVHKCTTFTLCFLSVLYFLFPSMPVLYPLFAVTLSFLYAEIIGRFYFRRKF